MSIIPHDVPRAPRQRSAHLASSAPLNGESLQTLSAREREILWRAVEGRTDEQIAQAVGISTSTVNSYWVRIRGKLGPLSRTELVGLVLRHETQQKCAALAAENARLLASERQAREELAQVRSNHRAESGDFWHLLALDHAPDATLVCRAQGDIVYANLQAHGLFAAGPGELAGLSLSDLEVPQNGEVSRAIAEGFFESSTPSQRRLGVERPLYGYRRDGSNFRAILIANRFVCTEGALCVVTIRPCMDEVDSLVKMLRMSVDAV